MKNYLAIINENAGLLQDLSLMAANAPLDPERIKGVATKIQTQIRRADRVMKNLNRFAHSIDRDLEVVSLEDTVTLVLELSQRVIRNRGANITLIPPKAPIFMETQPFLLNQVIFRAVECCCGAADGDKQAVVSFGEPVKGTEVRFIMNHISPKGLDNLFTTGEDKTLLKKLKAAINTDVNNGFALYWADLT